MRHMLATTVAWLLPMLTALAQAAPTPAELVAQLGSAEHRAEARRQLLAVGRPAVPALVEQISADDEKLVAEVLALLTELGPDAGDAVPQLLRTVRARRRLPVAPLLATLAELAPYRAPGIDVDSRELQMDVLRTSGFSSLALEESLLAWRRLGIRLRFPRDAELDTLLQALDGYHAFRVELAVERLGQRGPAALAALPRLVRLLQRPEPKVLLSERTVPMHRKAARAVLAIAPRSTEAEFARAVLEGGPAPAATTPTGATPARAMARLAELLAELEVPAQRTAAAANLVALGGLVAEPVANALLQPHDIEFRNAALGVLHDLGPAAAPAVPQLLEALRSLSTDHTLHVLRALTATAPWCRDVVPELSYGSSVGSMTLLGRRIEGNLDAGFLTLFADASKAFHAAMAVDPGSSLAELATLLEDPAVATRERALVVLRQRGAAARAMLPTLAGVLAADHPMDHATEWLDRSSVRTRQVDRTADVQHLAAEAIVAIAPPDDPLVAQARDVLARPAAK